MFIASKASDEVPPPPELFVSSPHPLSGVRLFRATCAEDDYGRFLEESSKQHHRFWAANKERYAQFNFDSDAAYRQYIMLHAREFSEYNKFVWRSNFAGLWIYAKSRLLKM